MTVTLENEFRRVTVAELAIPDPDTTEVERLTDLLHDAVIALGFTESTADDMFAPTVVRVPPEKLTG